MENGFKMDTEYWKLEIASGNAEEVKIHIIFKKSDIPEAQMRILEAHIRLILMGCGRLDQNPTRR